MQITDLNHLAVHISNLDSSLNFYGKILGLKLKTRPAFDFEGAWFALGSERELHLIVGLSHQVHCHSRGNHFALSVSDIQTAAQHLLEKGISFDGIRTRPDGAKQIFISDPDGYVIELCQSEA